MDAYRSLEDMALRLICGEFSLEKALVHFEFRTKGGVLLGAEAVKNARRKALKMGNLCTEQEIGWAELYLGDVFKKRRKAL